MEKPIAQRKMKYELTYMNIFCAMLVIFIHCASVLISETDKSIKAFNIIFAPWRFSTFVVPAFIFLSGVKMFLNTKKINYFKFYRGRITRVILPYILWVTIFYIYFINHRYFDFSWSELFHAWYRGDLVGHFYFVIIIAQFYILMPVWSFVLRRMDASIGIVFSVLISVVLGYNLTYIWEIIFPGSAFPYEDIVFTKYLVYWVCGCYTGMYYEKFKQAVLNNKLFITLLFIVGGVFDITLAYKTYGITALWMDNVHLLYCASAILFFFMLFTWLADGREKIGGFTKALDSQCYNIYLSHCLVVIFLNDYLLVMKGVTDIVQRFWVVTAAAYIVTILFWMLWWCIKHGIEKLKKHIKLANTNII